VKSLLKWPEALQHKPRRAGIVELPVVGLEPTLLSEQDFEACLHCWRIKGLAVVLAYFWPITGGRTKPLCALPMDRMNPGFRRVIILGLSFGDEFVIFAITLPGMSQKPPPEQFCGASKPGHRAHWLEKLKAQVEQSQEQRVFDQILDPLSQRLTLSFGYLLRFCILLKSEAWVHLWRAVHEPVNNTA
jgi:hypothetical protein